MKKNKKIKKAQTNPLNPDYFSYTDDYPIEEVWNTDKAFERRFLYKIKFEKPTIEARISMWHEMIPSLNEEQCHTLASKYDFSGGQIENIARHFTIGNILHGEPENVIKVISSYCDSEQLETKETIKVGFC